MSKIEVSQLWCKPPAYAVRTWDALWDLRGQGHWCELETHDAYCTLTKSVLGLWCTELAYPVSIHKTGRLMNNLQVGKISNPSLAPLLPGSLISYKIKHSGKEFIWDREQGTETSSSWLYPMVMNKGMLKSRKQMWLPMWRHLIKNN